MKPIKAASEPSLRADIANLLSSYTHDATNPLINLESLLQYLQRQSDELSGAISSGHSSNITHLMEHAIPETMAMMHTSSAQMRAMNSALNQLYHCHCDDLHHVPINLNLLVKTIITHINPPAHINIRISDLPHITADNDAMQIIFTALIRNAINSCYTNEFQKSQTFHIDISASNDNGCIQLRIKDQGCGLSPDEINKIFIPFYKGIKSQQGGLGIGLSMAQALLNRYGSRIDCASVINHGSNFTIHWRETAPVHVI